MHLQLGRGLALSPPQNRQGSPRMGEMRPMLTPNGALFFLFFPLFRVPCFLLPHFRPVLSPQQARLSGFQKFRTERGALPSKRPSLKPDRSRDGCVGKQISALIRELSRALESSPPPLKHCHPAITWQAKQSSVQTSSQGKKEREKKHRHTDTQTSFPCNSTVATNTPFPSRPLQRHV